MSDDHSARLALPLLHAGQAQKEIDHNEALALLDIAVQPAVVAVGLDVPPAAPAPGACWIVGESPVGDWAGHAGALAGWSAGGWRFFAPLAGLRAWSIADGCDAAFDGAVWRLGRVAATAVEVGGVAVVGARQAAIADPAGGATVDTSARDAIVAVLGALRAHGLIAT